MIFLSGTIIADIAGYEFSAVIIFIVFSAVLAFFYLLIKCNNLQQKHRMLELQLQEKCSEIAEKNEIIKTVTELGRISYFLGNMDSSLLAERNSDVWQIRMVESYLNQIHPADHDEFRKNCSQLFSGECDTVKHSYSRNINGQYHHFKDSAKIITNAVNGEKKFMLTSMDVSNFVRKNQVLADADSIVEAVFRNLPGHIYIKDVSSNFSYVRCSPTFSSLVQLQPDEITGKSDFDLFSYELAQRIRYCDLEITRTGSIADNRWFFSTPDGKEHAIRFISRLLQRADGSQWIIGFGVDVTRQEHIANKLRRRNKELRLLLAQHPYLTMLLNTELTLTCATPAMQKLLTFFQNDGDQEFTCKKLCRCTVEDPADCAAFKALQSGKTTFCSRCSWKGRKLKIKPLTDEEGTVNYLAATLVPDNAVQSTTAEVE